MPPKTPKSPTQTKSPTKVPKGLTTTRGRPDEPGDVPPRVARRERRRERSREEIIEAARRVLLEKGLAATTLDAVAKEVGLTKAALYYYYPSKDALFFEIIYTTIAEQAHAVEQGVRASKGGGDALRAVVRETMQVFGKRLDDFRLTYLHGQVAGPGAVDVAQEQLARIRPLNELLYGAAAKRLSEDWKDARGRARVEPRLMAFLAATSALGLLTMKGLVESIDDPLVYTDEQLVEGLARIFEAAAAP